MKIFNSEAFGLSARDHAEERRRIIFTEDRKDHEDKPFDLKGQRLEPPLQ